MPRDAGLTIESMRVAAHDDEVVPDVVDEEEGNDEDAFNKGDPVDDPEQDADDADPLAPLKPAYPLEETRSLFEPDLPSGFRYRDEFITPAEERLLLEAIAGVSFDDFEMRGVVARRRVAFFGETYAKATARPLPAFLLPLRTRIGEWTGVPSEAFAMALINEYRPGSPIGWHRDASQYDIVAGISCLSACRMKFRPYRSPSAARPRRRTATHEIVLERRSAYQMMGESRQSYEHHIPPVAHLRYSVTFRTLR